jgi:superfamily II DNA or RNA helicase
MDFIDKTSITHQETYNNAIVLSEQRNKLIKMIAENMKSRGIPTMVLVDRLKHGELLQELIDDFVFVPGGDGSDDRPINERELNYRKQQLNRLEKNEIIMGATSWANQGIDAPLLGCLILGGSVANPSTIIQQIGRGLRKADNKFSLYVFDFKHKEKSLRNHFNSRLRTYKTEPEFHIEILKYNIDKGTYV